MSELVIRAILFLVVASIGFIIGGVAGALIGGAIDALIGPPSQPGGVIVAYAWGVSMLGGVLGAAGAAIWLGVKLGRSN